MSVDIEWSNELINVGFGNTLQELPGLSEEHKQKMLKAFESLSYYYKNQLFKQLDKIDESAGKNAGPKKVEFIEKFLFGHLQSEIVVSTAVPLLSQASEILVEEVGYKEKEYLTLIELDKLTGLENVKLEIRKLVALLEIYKLRKKYNLKTEKQALHMVFKGNPGTGKTTVARLLGKILKEIGVLSKGHVIEIDRSNLTSKFQGDIEQRIVEYVNKAKGGILFIDEIYSLHQRGDGNDQGKQGIEVLLKVMEDKREDFVCIGAGYVNEMNEFLGSNPGLLSRFTLHIDFEDYKLDELLGIATGMVEERDYAMDDTFKVRLMRCIQEEKDSETFGNARIVRNIVESSIREQALRLFNSDQKEISEQDLITLREVDFQYEPVMIKKSGRGYLPS